MAHKRHVSSSPNLWTFPGPHKPRFTTRISHPAKGNGISLRYGEYWIQGKRPSMEDAHLAVMDAEPASDLDLHFACFGIFDGHGGPRASEFAAGNLLKFLLAEKRKPNVHTPAALTAALQRVEREWSRKHDAETDGTCAAVVVIDGSRVITASIGDSEMVLSRGGKAMRLCDVHNPSRNEKEAKRIEEEGGTLDRKRMRVVDPSRSRTLAVSRAIGDLPYKQQKPHVVEHTIQANDAFLLIGCDGVWDVVGHQEAVDYCSNLLRKHRPHEVAKKLVEYAFRKGSADNLSACIIVLDHETNEAEK